MSERWILNASPLIVLARVGQTRLFAALAERVMVPSAVAAEIDAGPDDDPARAILQARISKSLLRRRLLLNCSTGISVREKLLCSLSPLLNRAGLPFLMTPQPENAPAVFRFQSKVRWLSCCLPGKKA